MKKLALIGTALVALAGPVAPGASAKPVPADRSQLVRPLPAVVLETGLAQRLTANGESQEHRALMLRSEGLNQKYHLGKYQTGLTPDEYRALMIRSEALNQRYGLGGISSAKLERGANDRFAADNPTRGDLVRSTPSATSTSPDFQWDDAGIGAAVLLGAVALIGAGLFEIRHHGRPGTA